MTKFDPKIYFDSVRVSLFGGTLKQNQVDGQNFVLDAWQQYVPDHDVRWLAYFLATAYHETSKEMWPIAEYGKGKGQNYGVPDPQTGETYYGRGFVQLTWKTNYQRADTELNLVGDESCVKHADNQLDPTISARTGYRGMMEAWFRSPHCFAKYFNATTDDPYGAREIINGDKTIVPSWSNGVSIGNLIKGYHQKFLAALRAATIQEVIPPPIAAAPAATLTIASDAPIVLTVVAGANVTLSAPDSAIASARG
jgi:putative chitinase